MALLRVTSERSDSCVSIVYSAPKELQTRITWKHVI